MKKLLKGGYILAENDLHIIKDGYIAVEDDIITYTGSEMPQEKYDEEYDLKDCILIPGLYNLHTHTPMTLLRGIGSGLPLDKWLNDVIFPIEEKITREHVSAGTRLALMEMLACGTVSFSDMYDMSDVSADEVIKAGMKANIGSAITCFDMSESYNDNITVKKSLEFFREYNNREDGSIITDFSVHSEYTSFDSIVQEYAEECKKNGARMHIHLSETKYERNTCKERHSGKTPVKWFNDLGVFDNPTIAAHCVAIDDEDMDILKTKSVTCIHNPTSNMKLGSGFMPLRELLDKGIRIAIGTDGAASNNNLNIFEEIHLASVIHNGYAQNPTIIKPIELLTMATKNGALAQGRSNAGVITAGYKADITAVNLKAPHMMPVHDLHALMVYSAQASDVFMTMVNGKVLYINGQYLTIDVERVLYDLENANKQLFHY
jgi:5-methylthioadenosine/S-adenosylhomocysteine deaminase